MKLHMKNIRLLIPLLWALFTVACGGGGGGGGGGSFTVNTNAGTNGSISPTSVSVSSGNTTNFIVTPDNGYSINSVTGCGGSLAGTTYITAAVTADCTVTATFIAKAWGTASPIETNNAGDARDPQVAFDANGNALAVWSQSDGTRDNIWANRYDVSTGWGTASLIETNNAGDARDPQVAVDANGNALAVWRQSDGTRDNIWANRYDVSIGWGTASLIETNNAGSAFSPQVAVDANGNALAVWYQSDGTRYNILANRYDVSTGWGTASLIETDNAGDARYPQVAFDATGNALAVWRQSDGTRDNIWANRYQ